MQPDNAAASTDAERLRKLLAMTYEPEGIEVWLAHAEKQGWTMDYQLKRAEFMATGSFS